MESNEILNHFSRNKWKYITGTILFSAGVILARKGMLDKLIDIVISSAPAIPEIAEKTGETVVENIFK